MGHNGATCIDHVQPVDPETQTRGLELLYGVGRIGGQQALHQFLDHGIGQAQQGDSAHHRPLGGLLHQRVGRAHQPLQAQHTALMQTLIQQHLQTGQGSNQCQRAGIPQNDAPGRMLTITAFQAALSAQGITGVQRSFRAHTPKS